MLNIIKSSNNWKMNVGYIQWHIIYSSTAMNYSSTVMIDSNTNSRCLRKTPRPLQGLWIPDLKEIVLVICLLCWNKILNTYNSWKEGFILAHSFRSPSPCLSSSNTETMWKKGCCRGSCPRKPRNRQQRKIYSSRSQPHFLTSSQILISEMICWWV